MNPTATASTGSSRETRGGLRCDRCDGLMLPERLRDDYALGAGPMECWGWRCVSCGELVDPLILQHRRKQAGRAMQQPQAVGKAG